MEQRINTNYILKTLVPLLLFDLIVLIIVFTYFSMTLKSGLVFCLSFTVIFCLFLVVTLLSTFARQKRLFQSNSPERLISSFIYPGPRLIIRIYNPILSLIPLWRPSQVYRNALFYTYYGQYDTAREEISKIKWEELPPIGQAHKKYIEALLAFLEEKDFKHGLELAQQAYNLQEVSPLIPGRNFLYSSYKALTEIGEILNGEQDTEIISSLEKKFKRYPILSKILIAWALEKAYYQTGDIQQAQEMRKFLTVNAPYCVAFI